VPGAYVDQVALRADSDPLLVAAAIYTEIERSGAVTITVRVEDWPSNEVIRAAVDASSSSPDVLLYVLGYVGEPDPQALAQFRWVAHLNVNLRAATNLEFLASFTALRSLTIQSSSARKLPLDFLAGMKSLTRLTLPGSVRAVDALAACDKLEVLHCSANSAVFDALTGHPGLTYLDVSFGSHRDLSALATLPALRGVALYRVVGLDGDDLRPLGDCSALEALSLGALKHVTHLGALTGEVRHSLRALLLERLPNMENLAGLAGCERLEQLGLYESRPKDRSLAPLRSAGALAHLVLGDAYPAVAIQELNTWYSGALSYRGTGPADLTPRWRTPIEVLGR
jgi:hypothetical protein